MKRLRLCSSVLLTVLLLLAALPSTAGEAPIEFDYLYQNGGAHNEQLLQFCEEFYELTNHMVKVNGIFVEGSYEGVLERNQLRLLSGDPAGITQAGLHYNYFMQDNLPVIPAQHFIDAEGFDLSDFFPKMLALGQNPDNTVQVGMPFGISAPVLYYNKDMFDANGIENPPTTFDEMQELAKQLTKDGNYGFYIQYPMTGNWMIQTLVENFGGRMISEDRKSMALGEAGVNTFTMLHQMRNVDKTMPVVAGDELGAQAQEMFKAGKVGMLIATCSYMSAYRKDCAFNLGVARVPNDGEHFSAPAGGACVYILDNGEEQNQAAWDFVKYITSPEQNSRWAQVTGYMVVRQSAVDAPELMGDYLRDLPIAQIPYSMSDFMTPWANFPGGSGTRYHRITQDNIDAMLLEELTPVEALEKTVQELNDLINGG